MSMLNENNGGSCKKRQEAVALQNSAVQQTRTSQIQDLIREQERFRKSTQALVETTESLKKEVALFRRDFQESRKSVVVEFSKGVWKTLAKRYERSMRLNRYLLEQDWFNWVLVLYFGWSLKNLLQRSIIYLNDYFDYYY
ncbi:hypothetical protein CAEBREN_22953 [Caenorhabditis brenneri]|uniref:Uncharacterized protein n=1 Tax=Caenorhabditis brenneri TaxID=135651 RepID=G0MD35_CAEBE|nr:hypothetical protein CAEBREN_22953 [Caenorhabditis brenneri]